MPKINIVIEKEVKDMTPEEVSIYVAQLEKQVSDLQTKYDTDIASLTEQHTKELEKVKTQSYNKFIQGTTTKVQPDVENELDLSEMVS